MILQLLLDAHMGFSIMEGAAFEDDSDYWEEVMKSFHDANSTILLFPPAMLGLKKGFNFLPAVIQLFVCLF